MTTNKKIVCYGAGALTGAAMFDVTNDLKKQNIIDSFINKGVC